MTRRRKISLLVLLCLAGIGIASGFLFQEKFAKKKEIRSDKCDPQLWQHVYKPKRLRVEEECISVSGYITFKKEEDDGDMHMRLDLDEPYKNLLNESNIKDQNGCLVVEVVCSCRIKEDEAKDACTDYDNKVFIPHKGAHVWVTGSYVYDKHNGWMEIHPVTEIRPF